MIPLRLERPAAGDKVTVPGPLVACRRVMDAGEVPPALESREGVNEHLRFQLPAEVLPFRVERVRLIARINAPGRRVVIAGRAPGGGGVDIFSADGPLGDVRVDVADERFLPDARGGLHVDLSVGDLPTKGGPAGPAGAAGVDKWTIDYLELEVAGAVADDR